MRGSLGCVVAGLALLGLLYFLFMMMMMIEPGIGILIMIMGIFVGAGVLAALVVWIYEVITTNSG